MLKNLKIATKSSLIITVILVVGFFFLWKDVDANTSELMENQITSHLTDAVKTRSYIIDNYVSEAEKYLMAYSKSEEIRNLMLNPADEEIRKKAQAYTMKFADIKGIFEGLYTAATSSEILCFTTEAQIGRVLREGEGLKELQNMAMTSDTLTNLGIMKTKKADSNDMVISMYYPAFKEGKEPSFANCIGYVGGAVYANELMDSLETLAVEGLPECEYAFLNAQTGEYLYNKNPELLCTVTEDPGYKKILENINNQNADETGMVEYVDAEGVESIALYCYMPGRNWVFAVKDTRENVYGSLASIRRATLLVCVVVAILIIVILNLILSTLGRKLKLISGSIKQLGEMKLDANTGLAKYKDNGDEVGIICNAMDKTCSNLKQYIGEVDAQLSTMSNGDFTRKSTMEFAGEFVNLQKSMEKIQNSLRDSFWEINTVTSELVVGSQSVSDSSTSLADAATRATALVSEIDDYIGEIGNELSESSDFAGNAKNQANDAADLVANSQRKMAELSGALAQIEEATKAIEGISNNLESISKQTNILALNAMVEASRAGDSGRGFGVVANEIRLLAEQSNEAALNAYELIQQTIERVKEGTKLGEETADYLNQVVEQTNTIDSAVSKIADSTASQNVKLQNINSRLVEIGRTVETTAAMAEQSAAASIELDDQINSLRQNVANYRI